MKKTYKFLFFVSFFVMIISIASLAQNAWINEIHYDNTGTDANEIIEVVIENAGSYTLGNFAVVLYNGVGGVVYLTTALNSANVTAGAVIGSFSFYNIAYAVNGIQNGAPDGMALTYNGVLIPGQWLSYEGPMTATIGPASGMLSVDIGVLENGTGALGTSLQLGGTGTQYSNFTWQGPLTATPGQLNNGQTISSPSNLTGYVYDFDGNALENAKIEKDGGASTYSDALGHYELTPLSAGSQQFKCSKTGYNAVLITIDIPSSFTVNQDFTLTTPGMAVTPGSIVAILSQDGSATANLTLTNDGNGSLDWNAMKLGSESYNFTISLFDSFGDGWSGGKLDVLVNGVVVLNHIALASGAGPADFIFSVPGNGEITTMFTAGTFPNDCSYRIFDQDLAQVWYSTGAAPNIPPPNILPGQLVGNPVDWFNLDISSGQVPPDGGTGNVTVTLDASQTPPAMAPGITYTADIVFSSPSGIPSVTVPVTLVVSDGSLQGPQELTPYIVDAGNGTFMLKWKYFTLRDMQFSHFAIVRDGVIVGTSTVSAYEFKLTEAGTYCYKVFAVYQGGVYSEASNEVCITYPLAPGVPVSNWALLMGAALILGYAVYMLKRRA